MKKFYKSLVSLVICITLMLSLTACGGKGGSSGSGGDGTPGNADNITDTKDIASILILSDDTVGFYLNTSECEKLISPDGNNETEYRISLRSEDWNVQATFSSFYAGVSYKIDDDNWGNASSIYNAAYVSKSEYIVMITEPGLAARFKDITNWRVTAYKTSDSDEKEIATPKNIVKEAGLADFADLMAKVMGAGELKGNWAGTYTTDGYGDYTGSIVVEVTEHNALYIKVNMDGLNEMEFIALEEVQGDEPDYFFADAKILNQAEGGFHVNIQYSKRSWDDGDVEEGLSFNTDDYSSSSSDSYKSASLEKFKPWFVKPDNYKDEDPNGTFARKDDKDGEYFVPTTDDYLIFTSGYKYTRADVEHIQYMIYSFDINGHVADVKKKCICASEADANKLYADVQQYPSRGVKYYLVGTILYEITDHDDDYYVNVVTENKMDILMRSAYQQLYYDCNYLYRLDADGNIEYAVYLSKPYTQNEINISSDDTGLYKLASMRKFVGSFSIDGFHPELNVYITDYNIGAYFGGPIDNNRNYMENPGELRINGRNIVGSQIRNVYDYNTDSYTLYIFFTEIEVSDDKAKAIQYMYKLSDPNDTSINFDTYKNFTPEKTFTVEYSMESY
ncbi:MAG: hypothetical protein IKX99_04425 [Lachnospiraceae bacterium]|nr:hypothetical protein [Lachnospiraceae bacterium]